MRISKKTDYALRAIFELALNYGKETLRTDTIAQRQGIPKRYLEHLLLLLKKAGLVNSFRGKAGGYCLGKNPREIKLGDIVRSIEGEIDILPGARKGKKQDVVFKFWVNIENSLSQALDKVTVEDLVNQKRRIEGVSNYSI